MEGGAYLVVLIAWMIALLVLYHKIFEVYYFDLGHGLLKELGVSFFLGIIMTGLTFHFWWLTAIIIIIAGLVFKSKFSNNIPFIIAVVLAIIVAILGISFRTNNDSDGTTESTYNIVIESEMKC